jgi:hypothetical protein
MNETKNIGGTAHRELCINITKRSSFNYRQFCVTTRSNYAKLSKTARARPSASRAVAVQVEFERHILKPGLVFKGKSLKPGAFQLWVRGGQRAPPPPCVSRLRSMRITLTDFPVCCSKYAAV